jgi:hypothetical protein
VLRRAAFIGGSLKRSDSSIRRRRRDAEARVIDRRKLNGEGGVPTVPRVAVKRRPARGLSDVRERSDRNDHAAKPTVGALCRRAFRYAAPAIRLWIVAQQKRQASCAHYTNKSDWIAASGN